MAVRISTTHRWDFCRALARLWRPFTAPPRQSLQAVSALGLIAALYLPRFDNKVVQEFSGMQVVNKKHPHFCGCCANSQKQMATYYYMAREWI
jgi:hypothetical protein